MNEPKGKNKYFYTSMEEKKKKSGTFQEMSITHFITMDVTNDKYMLYTEEGMLTKRIDYRETVS